MTRYELNCNTSIQFDENNKCISSFVIDGEEMIYGRLPFFSVKVRNKKGETSLISGIDFTYVSKENDVFKYTHELMDLDLIFVNTKDNLNVRINIKNKSDLLLEQAELASFGLLDKLKDENEGKGEILIPYNEGVKVTNLNRRLNSPFGYIEPTYPSLGKYFIFPNMISSQFISYIANNKGIYIGLHDKNRTTKHIDFNRVDNLLKLILRTFLDVDYGQDYIMDYDYVIKPFLGDMYDCFELYRNWLENNLPTNTKKIIDNDELPAWYHESPLVVSYPIRGENDGDTKMKENSAFFPYINALDELKNISNKIENKVMTLLMHYEGTAPWAPPYSFPPYGGFEMFNEFVSACHDNNILLGLYTSGFGWTNVSYRAEYDRTKQFEEENLKDIMCVDTNGWMKSTIVDNIRLGFDLCPKNEKSKQLIVEETDKLFASGVDYVQVLDQNHGGCSYFCYSSNHGHIPAPGKWQSEETYDLLARINKRGGLLGCESAGSEPFLGQLLFSDNRFILNYYIGMPVPMYGYIYHEYVNNFMGNQICMALDSTDYSYTYRLAYSFTCGDMFTIVLNNDYQIVDAWCLSKTINKDVALKFIKNLSLWRNKDKEFLHYGKMIKPLNYSSNIKEFVHEDGTILSDKAVLTVAFSFSNEIRQYFINYTLEEQTIVLDKEFEYYIDPISKEINKDKIIKIKPLSVVAIRREK